MTHAVCPEPDPAERRAANDLEWPALLEHLSRLCLGPVAAARMRQLWPAPGLETARARMQLVAEATDLLGQGAPLPRSATPELGEPLSRLERGAVATALELRDLLKLLSAARDLRRHLAAHRETHPAIAAALATDPALDELRDELELCIEPDGRVADAASPELREARRRVVELRRELQSRLGQVVRRYADLLRDEYWTERDGRYVLPVRSDAHQRVNGIVLGSSASGATLFVEPQEITALGNRLKVAEAEVEQAEARVLGRLSELAHAQAGALGAALEACVDADVLGALARWAVDTRSLALLPEADAELRLRGVRHPLLVAQSARLSLGAPARGGGSVSLSDPAWPAGAGPGEVVPNDIELNPGTALVISGPNAGGKTVALKCLGLVAWMARSGVPLPLEPGSHVGWMDPVLTDVSDEQSLVRSLSTFSAHVANLAVILERAGEHTLVLFDELAAGTDPEEGAALAAAVLEALVARRAAVAVTTHYERLKELGAEPGPFVNASLGFDLEQLTPTFRLVMGVPGTSSALAVASRYGVPAEVVARAQQLMPQRARAREELVQRLESERRALGEARRVAEEEARRQQQLTVEIELERKTVREKERSKLAAEARQLTDAVREARAGLRALQSRLAAERPAGESLRAAEREIDAAARHVSVGSELGALLANERDIPAGAAPPTERQLVVGTRVRVARLGASAEVLAPPKDGQVQVQAGPLRLTVPLGEVELDPHAKRASKTRAALGGTGPGARGRSRKGGTGAESHDPEPGPAHGSTESSFVPVRIESNTVNVRGLRVDEALEQVEAFIDRMLRIGEPAGFVLHGHGTGALKSAVREHLALSRFVRKSRPADQEDGGDAFTVFWLGG